MPVYYRSFLGTYFAPIADVLGEMRPIRYIEHPHTKPLLTPFVGKQLEVCEAFDLDVPEGCSPSYPVRQTSRGKCGQPRKNPVILNAELSS